MAFGFGFNKQKALSAAEKFVQQGKLQNAITEYEKILKNDAKDLTVANTVGDLYARLGESDKAIECFKNVGDAYATQGFTVKAIAMYKKITKIRGSLEGTLKLAELYTQQGLFNDARAQYLQVAEEFLKSGELEQAVRIFQKILEMDPENVAMRVRLGEVYIRLGKKAEAWQIFSAAAETLRTRGQLPAAEDILQRMMTLDPGNSQALLLRGRNALESGDTESAIKFLEKVADMDSHPEGMRDLLKAYLQAERIADAGALANKLLSVHNDVEGVSTVGDALMQAGHYQDALALYKQHAERMLAANSAQTLQNLHSIIGHVRENTEALNTLLELFQKAGENTHVSEVTELLAHAYVQSGDLAQARDLYRSLATLEPQNAMHMKNYEQVVAMMGGASSGMRLITAEEGAVMVDELEATAPFIEQHYSDAVALALRGALTDADLFISYNMPGKALVPLLAVVSQAPRDLRLNQRLAALHTRAERFAEAAVCCRTLEGIYSEAGFPDEAVRYGDLASKYEERTSSADISAPSDTAIGAQVGAPWPTTPVSKPAAAPASPSAHDEFTVHDAEPEPVAEFSVQQHVPVAAAEFDISDEWEGSVPTEPHAEPVPVAAAQKQAAPVDPSVISETVTEIRFYLGHFMVDQARVAFAKLEQQTQDASLLDTLRSEIEGAEIPAPPPEGEVEVSLAEPGTPETLGQIDEGQVEDGQTEVAPAMAAASAPHRHTLNELVSDLESSLGDGFLPDTVVDEMPAVAEAASPEAAPEPVAQPEPLAPVAAAHAPTSPGVLGEFVSDLEASLGDGFLKEAPVAETQPAYTAPAPLAAPAAAHVETPRVAAAAASFSSPVSSAPAAVASAVPALPVAAPATSAPSLTYKPSTPRPLADAPAKFSAAGVDLSEMFGELKHDLEVETTVAEEDPETHYNLGVAFREMGLLDEAIGELQKVCQSIDRGHKFPHVMQTYTWLAQCFLDKGVPEAAIRWYDKALKLPGLDEETRIALNYELGSSCEAAGDKPTALKHFMEVYGSNIDYRDVAERIKALKS